MKPVVLETPYGGDTPRNLRFLRACMYDCLMRGEAPYASHALYTQLGVLNDDNADERQMGISAGFEVRKLFSKTVFYTNLGESRGMIEARKAVKELGNHEVEDRQLPDDWEEKAFDRELSCVQARNVWIETMIDRPTK